MTVPACFTKSPLATMGLALVLTLVPAGSARAAEAPKPNIIFILADDKY